MEITRETPVFEKPDHKSDLKKEPKTSRVEIPRGISPENLSLQVKNTAPFLFASDQNWPAFTSVITKWDGKPLTHEDYFKFLLAAHWSTCGTFVPTDVDHQIRYRLWHPGLSTTSILAMVETTMDSWAWDSRAVSRRWVVSPKTGEVLSGHHGEWLSVAVAAYGATRRRLPQVSTEMGALIVKEVEREAQIYQDFKAAADGMGILKACTLIAHNLGDLDRVIDAWNLHPDDELRRSLYKVGHELTSPSPKGAAALVEAGRLNKQVMAIENHRHYALRLPRSLRKNQDFLLPLCPFLDDWGSQIARHPQLKFEEIGDIVQALIFGWERLTGTVGYSRALRGIEESFPGGLQELLSYVPASKGRILKAGLLRSLCSIPRERFEKQFARTALHQV